MENKSYCISMACPKTQKSLIPRRERPRMGELNTFPVSYKIKGQRIAIVGGGEEALAKARLAVKTTASVVILATEITADFSGLDVELRERAFEPADLDGVALVFVADHGPDGEAAKRES